MDGKQDGWQGRTFVVRVDPVAIYPLQGGWGTRIWLMGDFTLDSLYVGPVSGRGALYAAAMYQCTFNGGNKSVAVNMDNMNNFIPVMTDTLPIGLDGSRGLIVSGYIDPYGNGVVGTQSLMSGWHSAYLLGDDAANVDKSGSDYIDTTSQFNSAVVWTVEGYYTDPASGVSTILP
jgi:hypothetical protein